MPSLQISSNFLGLATITQNKLMSVTQCNFSCNLSRNIGRRNPLQVAEDILHFAISSCSSLLVSKSSMQSLQKIEPSSTLCKSCNAKNVARQVAKRVCYTLHSTRNLSFATPLQHKLQRNLPRGTLTVELGSTLSNECRVFWKPLPVASLRLQRVF